MKIIRNIKKVLKNKLSHDELYAFNNLKTFFWQINWLKTIWFNFKALPFKQAIKIPFIISYNVKIRKVGNIELPDSIHTGMVSIGVIKIIEYNSNFEPIYFTNHGTLRFHGNTKIHPGVKLFIKSGACLDLGARTNIGFNSKVICYKLIKLGNDFRMSWEGQIFDTDFHFLYNIEKDKYYQRTKPVIIGKNVFIGNRCTIGKGTEIPDGSVVSCVSKVSGVFSDEGENLLLSGNPAKVIKKGLNIGSGWFLEEEAKIAKLLEEEKWG